MISGTIWWLIISLLGWAIWPVTRWLFTCSPGRGWAVTRLVGLVLATWLYWLVSSLGLIPPGRAWAISASLGCVLGGIVAWYKLLKAHPHPLAGLWREILVTELLFAAIWVAYLAFRGGTPAIQHTEQPMDLAMLSATLQSRSMPPIDPWLAGEPVSYYYGGYLIVGLLAHLTATPAPTAYNLGLALYATLATVCAYGALRVMLASGPGSARGRLFALLGALALVGCSNLEPALEFVHARYGIAGVARWFGIPGLAEAPVTGCWLPEDIWWWRASRIATDAAFWGRPSTLITEFPAFSFLLGDLHPHLMGLPFIACAMAIAAEHLARGRQGLRTSGSLAASALVLGHAGFVNTWDLPVVAVVVGAAWGLGRWARSQNAWRSLRAAAAVTAGLLGAGVLLYAPFYAQLVSQVQGLDVVILTRTRPRSFFLHMGLWYLPIVLELLMVRRAATRSWARVAWLWLIFAATPWLAVLTLGGIGTLVLAIIGAVSSGPWLALALAGVLALLVDDLWWLLEAAQPSSSNAALLGRLSALIGTVLVLGAEFFFVRDLFGTRMNTVFKVYQQSWVLLVGAASCAVYRLYRAGSRARWGLVPIGVVLLLAVPYLPLAAYSRWVAHRSPWTLDGARYLIGEDPDAYAAYLWLLEHRQPDDVLVEAPGEDYDPATSRLSAFTGVPTILGWPGHELQWRGHSGMLAPREADLRAIFMSSDENEIREVLERYRARYIHIGSRERTLYGITEEHLDWLAGWMDAAFSSGEVLILEVPESLQRGHQAQQKDASDTF